MPLRLRLLTREVDRLRQRVWDEVERARAACEVAQGLVEERERRQGKSVGEGGGGVR